MAVTETSGNGYALYNSVKLPKLPEWDKVKYPYALIRLKTDGVTYQLCYCDRPIEYGTVQGSTRPHITIPNGESGTICISTLTEIVWGEAAVTKYDLTDGSTYPEGVKPGLPGTHIWCNVDIPNLDNGKTYLSATAPIHLDGMNVIEWDGDTSGLVTNGTGFYKVSDKLLTTEEGAGSVLVANSVQEGSETLVLTANDVYDYADGITLGYLAYSAPAGIVFPEDGTYFIWSDEDGVAHTSLLAYTPTPVSEPDFDLKSYEIGFLAGLVSRGQVKGTKQPVAYLYNGVRLPALPEWDKETYPYAAIIFYESQNVYRLCVSNEPGYVYWLLKERIQMGDTYGMVDMDADAAEWGELIFHTPETNAAIAGEATWFIWANHDICYPDDYSHDATLAGTVKIAASDPIPVYE